MDQSGVPGYKRKVLRIDKSGIIWMDENRVLGYMNHFIMALHSVANFGPPS